MATTVVGGGRGVGTEPAGDVPTMTSASASDSDMVGRRGKVEQHPGDEAQRRGLLRTAHQGGDSTTRTQRFGTTPSPNQWGARCRKSETWSTSARTTRGP